jgi:hypothetical protein
LGTAPTFRGDTIVAGAEADLQATPLKFCSRVNTAQAGGPSLSNVASLKACGRLRFRCFPRHKIVQCLPGFSDYKFDDSGVIDEAEKRRLVGN